MFEGAYNPIYSNSMADFGGRRILGTHSLMNYINTGNASNSGFLRKKGSRDMFYSNKPKHRFDKLIAFLTIFTAIAASFIALGKKGGTSINVFKSLADKFKPNFSKIDLKKGFNVIKNRVTNTANSKTSDGVNVIYNDIHNFTSRAAKKASNAESAKEFFAFIKNKA